MLELAVVTSSSAGLDGAGEIPSSSEEREKSSFVSTWKAATRSQGPARVEDGRPRPLQLREGKVSSAKNPEDFGAEFPRRNKGDGL